MLYEICPVIVSIILLYSLKIKKGNRWYEKIDYQMLDFELKRNVKDQVHDIADDICTSFSFIGAIWTILSGVVIAIIKECVEDKTVSFLSFDFVFLLVLFLIYIGSLFILYRMKDVLLDRKCRIFNILKFSYAQMFNSFLWFGYVIMGIIIIKNNIS